MKQLRCVSHYLYITDSLLQICTSTCIGQILHYPAFSTPDQGQGRLDLVKDLIQAGQMWKLGGRVVAWSHWTNSRLILAGSNITGYLEMWKGVFFCPYFSSKSQIISNLPHLKCTVLPCNISTCLFLLIKRTVWGIHEEKDTDTLKPKSSIFINHSQKELKHFFY